MGTNSNPGAPNSGAFVPKNQDVGKSARTKAVREFSPFLFRKKVKNSKKESASTDGNWQNGDNKLANPMPNAKAFKW